MSLLDMHFKETCQNLQKLIVKTPRSVVFLLGGCLPLRAMLHLRQLTLFGMVARLNEDPLAVHARHILSQGRPSSKSWFWQIRDICLLYNLKHPLELLETPPSKETYRRLIKSHVISYWENKLRGEAAPLLSLSYFHPSFMSLVKPHPIWTTVGSNPFEVTKAIQQARFLSGRYRSESLASHWSTNTNGYCLAPTCNTTVETIEHILTECASYRETMRNLCNLWLSVSNPHVLILVLDALCNDREYFMQFLLDCSVLPPVILATQRHGSSILEKLFYLTRTWCYAIHRKRMKNLGRWNFQQLIEATISHNIHAGRKS